MNRQSSASKSDLAFWLIFVLSFIQPSGVLAQSQKAFSVEDFKLARQRISEPIDESMVVRIAGSRPRELDRAMDLGRMDGNAKIGPLILVLDSSPEQHLTLQKLLSEQQDKNSVNYHHWLTPDEFGATFGADSGDLQKIADWLVEHGLSVTAVARSRRTLSFSGTVAQVEEAFHTEIHTYDFKGERRFSNNSEASVPAALSQLLSGVAGLDNFHEPRPPNIAASAARLATKSEAWAQPPYTVGSSHSVSPGDFAVIYDSKPLIVGENGGGKDQTIAILGISHIDPNSVTAFRTAFLPSAYSANWPSSNVCYLDPTGQSCTGADPGVPSKGWETEAHIDVEWAGAVAPGANILYDAYAVPVNTNTLLNLGTGFYYAANYSIENNRASIINASVEGCETYLPWNSVFNALWEQAAAQGITVFVAATDSGAAGCDDFDSNAPANYGYAVNGFASTPYNVAVGGTEFYENGNDANYWTSTNDVPTLPYTSASGYIPERVWNDSCYYDPVCVFTTTGKPGLYDIWAGGGGVSFCYSKPPWQVGPGVPSVDPILQPSQHISGCPAGAGQHRYLPDVSLTASGTHDGYLFCQSDAGSTCTTDSTGNLIAGTVGGTSVASPAFAGIQALINQGTGERQGQANWIYYHLAANQSASACNSTRVGGPDPNCVFHDVTMGNNGVPCQLGSTGCVLVGSQYWLLNYDATPGYDLATGLGSVDVNNLLQNWSTVTPQSTSTKLDITNPAGCVPTSCSLSYGQTVQFMATVSAPSDAWGPPLTGQIVTFTGMTCSETQSNTAVLALGVYPISGSPIATNDNYGASCTSTSLPAGTDTITATFSPGSSVSTYYGSSYSTATVTVQPQSSLPTLTMLSINPSTITTGSSATVTATLSGPAPSSGAQVSLYPSNPSAFPAPSSLMVPAGQTSGSTSSIVGGPVSGSTNVVVNGFYNNATVQASVVVNPAGIGLTITLSASATTLNAGQSATLTAIFTGASKGAPTGLAYFYDYFNGVTTNIGNVSISSGGQYSAALTTGSLLAGQHAFTVIYDGDSNYSPAYSNVANVTAQPQSQGSLRLSNFTLSLSSVVGGNPSWGNVFLTGNAPAGGATVALSSSNTHFVQVPPTATVAPGYNSVVFPITTVFTDFSVSSSILASYNNTTYGASLTVLPVDVNAVEFSPSSVTAGGSTTVTVYLTGPAPAGKSVTLTSSNPAVLQIPSNVPVVTGATQVSVTGTTFAVGSQTSVTVTANFDQASGQGSLTVVPAPTITSVSVSCSRISVQTGQTSQCMATVTGTGSYSSAVSWGASAGTISSLGLFTAPSSAGSVTITATSTQDTTMWGTATVTVTAVPTITSVSVSCSPTSVQTGQTSQCMATVTGTGSYSSAVSWGASAGTINSLGLFTAPGTAGSVAITATSTQDNTKSGTATVTVTAASTITSVSVSCSPTSVQTGQTSQCMATVTGTGSYSSAVSWGASAGTINSSGLFTAPGTAGSVTITATSTQDNTKSGTATVVVGMGAVGLSPTSLAFQAQSVGTTSAPKTVVLTNTGNALLTISSITVSGDFSQTNNCGTSVSASSNCTISITFTPTAGGTRTGTVTITDNAGGGPQTITLTGAGITSLVITASSASMTYGGAVPTITPSYSGFVSGDGPGSLATQPTCTTTATSSSPVGTYPSTCTGAVDTNYTITYTGGTVTVGKAPLAITASSASMTFGGSVPAITASYGGFVNGDSPGSLTTQPMCSTTATSSSPVGSYPSTCAGAAGANYAITYTGGSVTIGAAPLTITAPSMTITAGATIPSFTPTYSGFVNGQSPSSLSSQPTCTTTATSSSSAGTYPITCSGAVDSNYHIIYVAGTLTVTGATTGTILLTQTSLTFPNQTVGTPSTAQNLGLTNNGTAALNPPTITITGANAGDFSQTNNCQSGVNGGATCSIQVIFTPTAAGTRTATLNVTDSNASNSPQTVSLTGTGIGAAPEAGVSPGTLTFSSQLLGTTSSSQPVTLSNTGTANLTVSSIVASGDFSQTNTCGGSVSANGSCTINVIFAPATTGTRSGTLTVTDNNNNTAGSTQTVSLSGTGADFTLAPPSGSLSTQTVSAGQPATYTLSVGGGGGPNQTVAFTCTGYPSGSNWTVTPNPAAPGSNVTVTVTTTARSTIAPRTLPPPRLPGPQALFILTALLAGVAWALRGWTQVGVSRRRTVLLPLAAGLLLALTLAGCGGGGNLGNGGGGGTPPNPGTPAGTYPLTVTGTAGSGPTAVSHTVTLTLTVT